VTKPLLRDSLLAVIAFAAQLAILARHGGPGMVPGDQTLDAVGVVLAAIATLPLLFWRRNVLAVFVLTTIASCTLNLLHYPPGPPVGATIALFLFAAAGGVTRRTVAVVTFLLGAHVATAGIGEGSFPTAPLVFGIVVWTLAVFVGERARLSRERRAALDQRARADERTRIARDLHDSVGHAINVILVQAGAARLLRERDPERSEAALQTIEDVARQTITEIDALVRALRDDDGGNGHVEAQPGLAALDTLLSRHRLTGLDVTVHREVAPRPLPRRVDQAAYRILQEALTNAARYGTGRAEIDVRSSEKELELTVRNPVSDPTASAEGGGHGLTGMRERAELLSGSLTTGVDDGAFIVHAHLPLEAHA
jgi:signal transduction histidine kinase